MFKRIWKRLVRFVESWGRDAPEEYTVPTIEEGLGTTVPRASSDMESKYGNVTSGGSLSACAHEGFESPVLQQAKQDWTKEQPVPVFMPKGGHLKGLHPSPDHFIPEKADNGG